MFAAFHSSSAGATEDCGAIWSARPYLISGTARETADEVPNYISSVELSALDFRDTVLYARPDADFTGDESEWIGEITHDESGRVASAVLGGEAQRYGAAQVLHSTEGSMAAVSCLESGENGCERAAKCLTLPMWKKLDAVMDNYLSGVSVQDLLDGKRKGADRGKERVFSFPLFLFRIPIDNAGIHGIIYPQSK